MGFGQEMKDFIAAAQAGQKILGANDDADYQRVKKKYLQAQLDTISAKNLDEAGEGGERRAKQEQANIDKTKATTNAQNALAARYRQLGMAPPPSVEAIPAAPGMQPTTDTPAAGTPAAPTAPAVPVVTGQLDPAESAAGIPQDDQPTQQAAVGGPIKRYAAGGAVTPDDDEDDDTPDPTQVAAVGSGAMPTPQYATSAPQAAAGFSTDAAHDAIDAGIAYGQKHYGLDQMAALRTPGMTAGASALKKGAHAAPLADMDQVKKAVDPNGTMGESTRNLAAIGAVYQFKMNKGDVEGAQRAAFQMIQHYRVAADKYAAIAAAAGEKGNVDVMVHAAMKAYANVPDGKNFNIAKMPDGNLQYTFTDDQGNVVNKGIEPPDKLAAAAMGMVRGGFDRALNDRAGVRNAPEPTGPKPMKTGDKAKVLDQIDEAYKTQNPDVVDPNDSKKMNPKYTPDDQTLHKSAAYRIAASPKNDVTPDEATQIATKIADPTIPDKGGFSPKKVDGGYEVSFGKRKTFVPEDDFDNLMAKRNEILEANKAKADKAAEEAKKPGLLDTAVGAIGRGVEYVGKKAKESMDRADADTARRAAVPATPDPDKNSSGYYR